MVNCGIINHRAIFLLSNTTSNIKQTKVREKVFLHLVYICILHRNRKLFSARFKIAATHVKIQNKASRYTSIKKACTISICILIVLLSLQGIGDEREARRTDGRQADSDLQYEGNVPIYTIFRDSEECFRNTFDSTTTTRTAPRQRMPCTEVFYTRKTSPT